MFIEKFKCNQLPELHGRIRELAGRAVIDKFSATISKINL